MREIWMKMLNWNEIGMPCMDASNFLFCSPVIGYDMITFKLLNLWTEKNRRNTSLECSLFNVAYLDKKEQEMLHIVL